MLISCSSVKKYGRNLIEFGYIVAGMEAFPAADESQFDYIKKQIDSSDYYLLIIGGRYGSVDKDGISFTEKEFDYAVQRNIPVFVFPIKDPQDVIVKKTDEDPEKARKLAAFREKACDSRLARFWSEENGLVLGVLQALQTGAEAYPRPGWVRGYKVANEEALGELVKLQKEYKILEEKLKAVSRVDFDQGMLGSWTQLSFYYYSGSKNIKIAARDVLKELSAFNALSMSSLKHGVERAIAAKGGLCLSEVAVEDSQLDHVVVMLAKLHIISLVEQQSRLMIARGPNFVPAMLELKSSGWVCGNPNLACEAEIASVPIEDAPTEDAY